MTSPRARGRRRQASLPFHTRTVPPVRQRVLDLQDEPVKSGEKASTAHVASVPGPVAEPCGSRPAKAAFMFSANCRSVK